LELQALKANKWKDGAELVGIVAIVASLIFVGLQLRQDQTIAGSQVFADYVATDIAFQATIADYSDILVKGNAGTPLNEVERHQLRILMQAAEDRIYQHGRAAQALGLGMGRSERTFASFLYRNPVAMEAWIEVGEDMEQYFEPLLSENAPELNANAHYNDFRVRVQNHLDKLDELYGTDR
jgi:hypothetical protein